MAKYGIGANAMMENSKKPRERNRHIMGCCPAGWEREVFKWSDRAGVIWLSRLCDETGARLRTETLSHLTSNTPAPHAAGGTETARVLDDILSEVTQTGPSSQGSKLNTKKLGPWNELIHHHGYAGSFVESTKPGEEPRLTEVSSAQDYGELEGSVL